jgi:hypothetical protein
LPDPGLDAIRAHLDDAHAAADRLVQEAQRQAEAVSAAGEAEVPPRGWEAPRDERVPGGTDLHALLALLDAVRHTVPPDLSRQLAEALRDLLVAVRALIDWYLERLGAPDAGEEPPPVRDIPLD